MTDEQPTPETDAQQSASEEAFDVAGLVPAPFARELERDRNRLRAELIAERTARNALEGDRIELQAKIGYLKQRIATLLSAR